MTENRGIFNGMVIGWLTHSGFIVFVGILSQVFTFAISTTQHYCGVLNAVKHICFNGGVMVHVFKCEAVAHFERYGKTPIAHKVAAET